MNNYQAREDEKWAAHAKCFTYVYLGGVSFLESDFQKIIF
jgi:hypothetical protein